MQSVKGQGFCERILANKPAYRRRGQILLKAALYAEEARCPVKHVPRHLQTDGRRTDQVLGNGVVIDVIASFWGLMLQLPSQQRVKQSAEQKGW